ncbi:MAG: hypothetical protein PF961_15175 [Planctomycetota bacterium]|jgi:trans-2-enoyl-CoA reductase|nr:hypothetical protein [Planctomycetota bacterium]
MKITVKLSRIASPRRLAHRARSIMRRAMRGLGNSVRHVSLDLKADRTRATQHMARLVIEDESGRQVVQVAHGSALGAVQLAVSHATTTLKPRNAA